MHLDGDKKSSGVHPTTQGIVKRGIGRVLKLAGALGLGLTVSASATSALAAQPPAAAPKPVPQHWISYAQMAANQFEAWLSDPASDTAVRLHGWIQERMLKEGQPLPPPLVVRVWVAASGQVERIEFASLGQAQADADLRSLMTAQSLSEPPPRDMRQPMVLQLTLRFSAAA